MSKAELLGYEWENENLKPGVNFINVLSNDEIGTFVITLDCLTRITFDSDWKEDDYRILSLIHEKTVIGKPYFIYDEEEQNTLERMGTKIYEYTPVKRNNILEDYPKNIIEIQRRSLFLLYKKAPHYGEDVGNISPYDFFACDYSDWLFIVEAMQHKNWINANISKSADGTFVYVNPFLIAEDGWFEIEKELEMKYSKQVFVAMWFDKSMDNAARKIEKAIEACGLKAMIINKKEHNNEISGEILTEIMKSRIVIADVTGQRNGVYFEAGFALGHRKSVIWTCQRTDLENVHFDTRQYNHVVWETEDDLYEKLRDRILATLVIENI